MSRLCASLLLAGLTATLAGASELPPPPDVAPIAALVTRPTGNCNAADSFLRAEEILRPELDRNELALQRSHPAVVATLAGLACRRCEFPYSRRLAIPPTEQPIPMSRLYAGVAAMLFEEGEGLLAAGRPSEAERSFVDAARLGLLLHEEPGLTIIQEILALNVLARAAEGLGDLAIARGDETTAATCARFLARRRAYVDGAMRFVRELGYARLARDPRTQADKVREVVAVFAATQSPALRAEMLLYLSLASGLVENVDARSAARAILEEARSNPDQRIRALAEWGLMLTPDAAREQVRIMASSPWP
jgi:hypothetical protein